MSCVRPPTGFEARLSPRGPDVIRHGFRLATIGLTLGARYRLDDILTGLPLLFGPVPPGPRAALGRAAVSIDGLNPRGSDFGWLCRSWGAIYVKFGQILSTAGATLLPVDIADELAGLQDNVPPPFDARPGQGHCQSRA